MVRVQGRHYAGSLSARGSIAAAVGWSSPDSSPATISRASCRPSWSCSGSRIVFTAAATRPSKLISTSTVSSSRRGMYGSSGTPTRTRASRPSGSVAVSSTGSPRRLMGRAYTRPGRALTAVYARPVLERIVSFPARTVFTVVGIVLAVAAVLEVLWIARHVLSWILISLFLALALNPAVDWLQHHRIRRRGAAVAITYVGVIVAVAALGATF